MQKDDCIFCKIAKGEIPTNKVYEDDDVVVFDDLEPLMPVHTLIIPKDHYRDLSDNVPPETLGKVFSIPYWILWYICFNISKCQIIACI